VIVIVQVCRNLFREILHKLHLQLLFRAAPSSGSSLWLVSTQPQRPKSPRPETSLQKESLIGTYHI